MQHRRRTAIIPFGLIGKSNAHSPSRDVVVYGGDPVLRAFRTRGVIRVIEIRLHNHAPPATTCHGGARPARTGACASIPNGWPGGTIEARTSSRDDVTPVVLAVIPVSLVAPGQGAICRLACDEKSALVNTREGHLPFGGGMKPTDRNDTTETDRTSEWSRTSWGWHHPYPMFSECMSSRLGRIGSGMRMPPISSTAR